MSVAVRVSGAWKDVAAPSVRVSGSWKQVSQAYVRVSGVWKELLSAAIPDIVLGSSGTPYMSGSSANTYTGTGLPSVGATERAVIAIAGDGSATGRDINTVTIGGQACSELQIIKSSSGISNTGLFLGPVGATGNVVVNLAGNWARASIALWPVQNIQSATPTDVANAVAGDPMSASIDCEAGGAVFGVAYNTNGGTFTWTGITEAYDHQPGGSSRNASGATDAFASAQTGLTVTADPSGSAAHQVLNLVAMR